MVLGWVGDQQQTEGVRSDSSGNEGVCGVWICRCVDSADSAQTRGHPHCALLCPRFPGPDKAKAVSARRRRPRSASSAIQPPLPSSHDQQRAGCTFGSPLFPFSVAGLTQGGRWSSPGLAFRGQSRQPGSWPLRGLPMAALYRTRSRAATAGVASALYASGKHGRRKIPHGFGQRPSANAALVMAQGWNIRRGGEANSRHTPDARPYGTGGRGATAKHPKPADPNTNQLGVWHARDTVGSLEESPDTPCPFASAERPAGQYPNVSRFA